MKTREWIVIVALSAATPSAQAASGGDDVYVEFLWAQRSAGDIARQQTLGFVMDAAGRHQVCVAVLQPAAENKLLQIDVRDAGGALVSSSMYPDFKGSKRCYDAQLGRNGRPGKWTFEIHLDGKLAAESTIQVARTLSEAPFYRPSGVPYVLGRPNYDSDIAPQDWKGRLVWVMTVDETGAVTNVEIQTAEGIGSRIQDRAHAAGRMSLFPPDPSRTGHPLKYSRELKFGPDEQGP